LQEKVTLLLVAATFYWYEDIPPVCILVLHSCLKKYFCPYSYGSEFVQDCVLNATC